MAQRRIRDFRTRLAWIGGLAMLAACGEISELPCEGDARNCDGPETSLSTTQPQASAPQTLSQTQSAAVIVDCLPGQCGLYSGRSSVRPGMEGRPARSDQMEAIRLRTQSNALNSEIARLPPGASDERRDLRLEQRQLNRRIRTLETPSLRMPPPGVTY